MQKRFWALLILVASIIGSLAASKWIQGFDDAFSYGIAQPFVNMLSGISTTIFVTPTWQSYGYLITASTGIVVGLFIFYLGHDTFNSIRKRAVVSAQQEAYGGRVGTVQPSQPITTSPPTATQRLQPIEQPIEPPKQEAK